MKKYSFLLITFILLDCKYTNQNTEPIPVPFDSLTEEMIGRNLDTITKDQKIVQNNHDFTNMEKLPIQVKKAIETSPHKEKTCSNILKEYEKLIVAIKKNPKSTDVAKLSLWINDPFYNRCYNSDASFRASIDKLDEVLESI